MGDGLLNQISRLGNSYTYDGQITEKDFNHVYEGMVKYDQQQKEFQVLFGNSWYPFPINKLQILKETLSKL